jgi:glycosyltransferase involved in cell wall biosynthesis
MRIAQISPAYDAFAGHDPAQFVLALTDELVRRGHAVTLFAPAGCATKARLVPVDAAVCGRTAGVSCHYPAVAAGLAFARAGEFDLIHSHLGVPALPFDRLVSVPVVHTLHERLDTPALRAAVAHFKDARLVSVSQNQRRLLPHWNWSATIYNGVDIASSTFRPRHGRYLAAIGGFSAEGGIEDAIAAARLSRVPLKIAGAVAPAERDFFEQRVRPLLDQPDIRVEYVGVLRSADEDAFLGCALALVYPVRWPEPFSAIVARAMTTGTPVVASRVGALPEMLVDGVTGFLCDSVEELALGIERIPALSRAACRAHVQQRFTAAGTAERYESLYRLVALPVNATLPAVPARELLPAERRPLTRRTEALIAARA